MMLASYGEWQKEVGDSGRSVCGSGEYQVLVGGAGDGPEDERQGEEGVRWGGARAVFGEDRRVIHRRREKNRCSGEGGGLRINDGGFSFAFVVGRSTHGARMGELKEGQIFHE